MNTKSKNRYMTLSTFKKNNQGRREVVARNLGYDNATMLMNIMTYPGVVVKIK